MEDPKSENNFCLEKHVPDNITIKLVRVVTVDTRSATIFSAFLPSAAWTMQRTKSANSSNSGGTVGGSSPTEFSYGSLIKSIIGRCLSITRNCTSDDDDDDDDETLGGLAACVVMADNG